jgi:hypothetical protein
VVVERYLGFVPEFVLASYLRHQLVVRFVFSEHRAHDASCARLAVIAVIVHHVEGD